MEEWTGVFNPFAEVLFHWPFSLRRIVVEVADELPSQHPHVVDVFLDGFRRQIRRGQILEKGTEQSYQLPARRQIFSSPIHERGQPFRSRQ